MRPIVHARAVQQHVVPIKWAVVALMVLALAAICIISPALLTELKIRYVATGGPFYEKLHPATYLVIAAFGLMLLKGADPIGEIDRIISSIKLLMVFLFCWGLLFLQCLILHRPFTGVIDSFFIAGDVQRDRVESEPRAKKAAALDVPYFDLGKYRSRLLRIFLGPPHCPADGRQPCGLRRMAFDRVSRYPARGLGHRGALRHRARAAA